MVNLNIILTVIIISIILIILILLTLNYFNKIENFRQITGKYGYICSYESDCVQAENRLCVTEDGYSVYACGDNTYGQLGISKTEGPGTKLIPTKINPTERISISNIDIKDVNIGIAFGIILTNDDNIYISGINPTVSSPGSIDDSFARFRHIPTSITNMKKIYTGPYYYNILTEDGKVYVCGRGTSSGGIGLGTQATAYIPTRLNFDDSINIKDISSSTTHTLYLTEDGEVYAVGHQYSFPIYQSRISIPTLIPSSQFGDKKIKKICAAYKYSIFVTEDDQFYYFGSGAKNLGWTWTTTMDTGPAVIFPSSALDGRKIKKISAALYHCLFLTEDGYVYGVGSSGGGQLGFGDLVAKPIPTQIPGIWDIKDIFAGFAYSMFLDNYGIFYSCGSGEIGLNDSAVSSKVLSVTESLLMPANIKNMYMSCFVNSGNASVFLLTEAGDLYAYGYNHSGELGLGFRAHANIIRDSILVESVYVPISIMDNVSEISSYNDNTLLLTTDGNVYGCGENDKGQLGFGTRNIQNNGAKQITTSLVVDTSLSNIKQLCCAGRSTMILTEDGKIYVCGDHYYGQLGMESFMITPSGGFLNYIQNPLTNVKKISTYSFHTIALLNDGTVYSYGWNGSGQLGFGDTTNRKSPEKIPINNVSDIATGYSFTLFLMNDGTVYSCGDGRSGQLGFDAATSNSPVKIPNLTNIVKIFTGYDASFFIDDSDTVWGCGQKYLIGIGNNSGKQMTPVIISINNVKSISSGHYHTLFLKNDDTVYCCGLNNDGQFGRGDKTQKTTPTKIPINNVKSISVGQTHSLFLKNDDTVYSCGKNDKGQLGFDDDAERLSPTKIPITGVKIISTSGMGKHNLIVMNDGSLYGFGDNSYGQLGSGSKNTVIDDGPNLVDFFRSHREFNNVHKIAVCTSESYFLKRDGSLYRTVNNFPEMFPLPSNIKKVKDIFMEQTAGQGSNYILTEDGEVYGWGYNIYGQLGLGDRTDRDIPTLIEYDNLGNRFNNIKKILRETTYTTMFLKNDGTVYTTGGQTGDASTVYTPIKYPFLFNIKDICIGTERQLFLTNDGYVYMTGYIRHDYSTSEKVEDVPLKLLMENITAISLTGYQAFFLTKYGDVYCNGATSGNTKGQLGLGHINKVYQVTHNPYLRNIKKIYAGTNESFFLLNNEG